MLGKVLGSKERRVGGVIKGGHPTDWRCEGSVPFVVYGGGCEGASEVVKGRVYPVDW